MTDTLVLLHLEHRNFMRVLVVLEGLIEDARRGAALDVELLDQILAYFQGYPDTCHHPKEDVVQRRLEIRAPELATRAGDIVGDHADLSTLTRATARRVRLHQGDPSVPVLDDLERFVNVYCQHLQAEEEVFFPLVEQALTAEDWAAIDFEMFDQDDPVFDRDAENHYRALRRAILATRDPREDRGEN